MIQLITTISDEISYYVTDEITSKLNTLLYELQINSSLNFFNTFDVKELEKTKKAMKDNIKIVSMRLDYHSIYYAKNISYALNVSENYIYDIVYRRIVKKVDCLIKIENDPNKV